MVVVGLVFTTGVALFDSSCSPILMPMPSPASREITIASASEPSRKRANAPRRCWPPCA